ncbi:MAG: 4Fe-4S single cluster domain-containing protein [Planctomycetaceae bacterium]
MSVPAQTQSHSLSVAQFISVTEAEGPGQRFALWVQGCPLRCMECCNPEMLPTGGGRQMSVTEVMAEILKATATHKIEGITLIGGEPFAQAAALAQLAAQVQQAGLTVMVFTGYTLDELRSMRDDAADRLLHHTDLLVDGRYDRSQPDVQRRWIGSRNQQIHFFSSRYRADDACWQQRDTIEVRWNGQELLVNGFPAKQATSLWKKQ